MKKNVLVLGPWKAEPKRRARVQMVYLEVLLRSRHGRREE